MPKLVPKLESHAKTTSRCPAATPAPQYKYAAQDPNISTWVTTLHSVVAKYVIKPTNLFPGDQDQMPLMFCANNKIQREGVRCPGAWGLEEPCV